MAFHFNPSLWFVCKLCREPFPDTDKLKAHKLESHLGESLNIKCIVFEEKLLDCEWIPPSQEFSCKHDQLTSKNGALSQKCADDARKIKTQMALKSKETNIFKNPYVSLKILTAKELNSTAAASGTKSIGGKKSMVGSECSFGLKGKNRKPLTKTTLNSVEETIPFPSKLPKIKDSVEDDARKNKIRELLRNAFTIKGKPKNDTGSRVFLEPEPQDMPISILSAYSPPPSPSPSSKIMNPLDDVPFNSLQQQQKQFQLQGNRASLMQNSSTTFDVANSPSVRKILPTLVMQPEQINSYPVILNSNGQPIQVQGEAGSDDLNIFDVTLPAQPETTFVANTFTGKVEFIEYDDSVANDEDDEIRSTKQRTHISHVNHNSSLPLKAQSTFVRRRSDLKIQKRYICTICSAAFGRNSHLTQHRIIHSNLRAFQCPKCASKFKTKSCLHSHSIYVHGSVSNFRCELCPRFFPNRKELLSHEASHNRVRPYQCDFPNCGTQLKSQSTLYVHTRLKHGKNLGLEQFECPTCGKTFGLMKFLRTHQKRAHQSPNDQILS